MIEKPFSEYRLSESFQKPLFIKLGQPLTKLCGFHIMTTALTKWNVPEQIPEVFTVVGIWKEFVYLAKYQFKHTYLPNLNDFTSSLRLLPFTQYQNNYLLPNIKIIISQHQVFTLPLQSAGKVLLFLPQAETVLDGGQVSSFVKSSLLSIEDNKNHKIKLNPPSC